MRILDEVWEVIDDLKDDKQKLQTENAKLREALAFYADDKNWEGFGKAHLLENSVADEALRELEGDDV